MFICAPRASAWVPYITSSKAPAIANTWISWVPLHHEQHSTCNRQHMDILGILHHEQHSTCNRQHVNILGTLHHDQQSIQAPVHRQLEGTQALARGYLSTISLPHWFVQTLLESDL